MRTCVSGIVEEKGQVRGYKNMAHYARSSAQGSAAAHDRHRERVASAGGEMLGAVFNFLGELVSQDPESAPKPDQQVVEQVCQGLSNCVQTDEEGRQKLTVTLPNDDALENLATTLASLLAGSAKE